MRLNVGALSVFYCKMVFFLILFCQECIIAADLLLFKPLPAFAFSVLNTPTSIQTV